jgi:hypothetical protein
MTNGTANPVGTPQQMVQVAPFPTILADLVKRVVLDPGWHVNLRDMQRDQDHGLGESRGLTLVILTESFDTYHPERGRTYRVEHRFSVPAATYNEQSWRRWLFDRYVDVLTHEGMEFFAERAACTCPEQPEGGYPANFEHEDTCASLDLAKAYRPFAPNHGPGHDPYVVREETTDLDRRTQYTGNVDHR